MAKLSYGQRKSMPKSSFAIPKAKTKSNPAGKGAYPIEDAAHARNALSRVSRFGTPAEKAAVRSKVHKRYPGIGDKEGGEGAKFKRSEKTAYTPPSERKRRKG